MSCAGKDFVFFFLLFFPNGVVYHGYTMYDEVHCEPLKKEEGKNNQRVKIRTEDHGESPHRPKQQVSILLHKRNLS